MRQLHRHSDMSSTVRDKIPPLPPPMAFKTFSPDKSQWDFGAGDSGERGKKPGHHTDCTEHWEDLSLPRHSHHGHHLCRAPHAHFYIHIATTTAMLEYITLDAASLKSVGTGKNSRNVIEKDGAKRRRRTWRYAHHNSDTRTHTAKSVPQSTLVSNKDGQLKIIARRHHLRHAPLYIHYNSHHQLRQRVHIKQETNITESAANKETPLFKIPWLTSGCLVPRFNLCTSFQAFCTMHTSQTGAGLTENRQGNAGP